MKYIHIKKVSTDNRMPLISHKTNKQQEQKKLKSTKVKKKILVIILI